MPREYTVPEAAQLLGIEELELLGLRKKVGIPLFGLLSEANMSAIRSYMDMVEGTKPADETLVRTCNVCQVTQPMDCFLRRGRGNSHTCESCEAAELEARDYQQPCSPLGGDQAGGDHETTAAKDDTHGEDTPTETEIDDDAPCISLKKAKALVYEAYALGAQHGKRIAVNDNVTLFELLEVAACQRQIS